MQVREFRSILEAMINGSNPSRRSLEPFPPIIRIDRDIFHHDSVRARQVDAMPRVTAQQQQGEALVAPTAQTRAFNAKVLSDARSVGEESVPQPLLGKGPPPPFVSNAFTTDSFPPVAPGENVSFQKPTLSFVKSQ